MDCSSSCGSPSGSISNKTQLFDVCVEMYCFHKITTYAIDFTFTLTDTSSGEKGRSGVWMCDRKKVRFSGFMRTV